MLTPGDLRLPYADWQPGQWDIVSKLVASDKKYIFLEAPTGTGKSALVTAYANLLDQRLVVCTGTKQLQDQYSQTLDYRDVRGRANFPCLIENVKASEAVCTVGGHCDRKISTRHHYMPPVDHESCEPCRKNLDRCGYYDQRYLGERADKSVLNYAMWLTMANYAGAFAGRDVTVFDEAHTLEDEIRRFATVHFSSRNIDSMKLPLPFFDAEDVESWQEWCRECKRILHAEHVGYSHGGGVFTDAEKDHRRRVNGFMTTADMFLSMRPEGWVGVKDRAGFIDFKPVWIGPLAHMLVYKHLGPKTIFMSGTILDRELFAGQLGLDPEEVDFIRIESPFDVRRRPLYYQPVGKVSAQNWESVEAAVTKIDEIVDKYPGQHGIIHTVSYALARQILIHSRHTGKMIGHEGQDKARQLDLFKSRPGSIWISPSSGVGLDLPYDLCDWQIIAKLPFPNMADKQIKQAMKVDADGRPAPKATKWYNWQTLCNVIQMYGRGMRAPDDKCDTYLIDENWKWFRMATKEMQPRWFQKSIIWPRPVNVTADSRDDLFTMLRKAGVQGA